MSRLSLTEKFRKLNILSISANGLLIALFLLMTMGAGAQIAELSTAAKGVEFAVKAADLAATKDFIWLILFICASLVWVVYILVRAVLAQAKEAATAEVKTATAIQRLCDVIEDRTPLTNDRNNRKSGPTHQAND